MLYTPHLLRIGECARQAAPAAAGVDICWYLLLATSQATWTAVHEAHNHHDARAGCGRDQWSGGAQPC